MITSDSGLDPGSSSLTGTRQTVLLKFQVLFTHNDSLNSDFRDLSCLSSSIMRSSFVQIATEEISCVVSFTIDVLDVECEDYNFIQSANHGGIAFEEHPFKRQEAKAVCFYQEATSLDV